MVGSGAWEGTADNPVAPTAMLRNVVPVVFSSLSLSAQVCQTQLMPVPDPQANARVGTAVARDGDTLVAGGPNVDNATGSGGAVYVWRQQGATWGLEQKLATPNQGGPSTVYGRSVAVRGDRMVVGGNPGLNAVWVHRRTGTQWSAGDAIPPSGYTYAINFGHSVAVDGDWIAVGAPQALGAAPVTVRTGAVYVYRDLGGVVVEVDQLRPPSSVATDDIGISLAMRGGVLAVGSATGSQSASTGAGAVFVYRVQGGQMVLETTLQSPAANPGRNSTGAGFGQTVATDGVRIAVADLEETPAPFQTGAVHIWVHQAGSWVLEGSVFGLPNTCGFGSKLAIDGDELVVGQVCGHRVAHVRRVGGQWLTQGITPVQSGGSFQVTSMTMHQQELAIGSWVNPGSLTNAGQVLTYRLGSGSMPYGNGLAGSGGRIPSLFGTGCPRVGQPYSIDLAQGLGGGFALLAFGYQHAQAQVVGGTLWVGSIGGSVGLLLGGGVGQPGAGGFQFPFAVPSPAFVGLRLYCQAGVLDPGAVQGFALSNGLEVVLGN